MKNWGVYYRAFKAQPHSRHWILGVNEQPVRFTRADAEQYAARQNRSATAGSYRASEIDRKGS